MNPFPLNNFNFREREDHFPAIFQVGRLSLEQVILKMPRQHEKVAWLHLMSSRFGYNWNVGSWRKAANFFFVHLSDTRKVVGRKTAEL